MGGNSSRLLRFSWLGGDLAVTRGTSFRFLLPPLHDALSFFPSSSSARERPRSRATCRPEALTELLPFLLPRLAGKASGAAVRKLPRLAFWAERFSLWVSTGLYPKLGLLLDTTLGKSLQGLDRFDPEKEEEPLDAAAGEKLVSVVQEVTGVLWEKSCTRLLVAWPALLSGPVLWLLWALELGVLAGVEGPLVSIWLVCSLKKFSRKGTKSFWSKLSDTSLSWMWFSYKKRGQSINIMLHPHSFFSLVYCNTQWKTTRYVKVGQYSSNDLSTSHKPESQPPHSHFGRRFPMESLTLASSWEPGELSPGNSSDTYWSCGQQEPEATGTSASNVSK